MELIFEVYDYNALMPNELIGYHSVGLSTMYRHMQHEFYRTWVPLFNPQVSSEPQGFLLISCFIIGPNEKPPAHRKDQVVDDDEDDLDDALGPDISDAKKREIQEKKKGIFLLKNPAMFEKKYLLNISIIKVEGIPTDEYNTKYTTYCSARVLGNTVTTGIVRNNLSPAYNCKLSFPVLIPILNEKINIKIWVQGTTLTSDYLLANIPEIPDANDPFNIPKLQGNEGRMPLRWFNLYGTKPEKRSMFGNTSSAYYLEGSAFLGRALISMNINPHEKPKIGKGTSNISKKPEEKQYKLFIDLIEIANADETEGRNIWIDVTWGLYATFTEHQVKYNATTKSYKLDGRNKVKPIKASYPIDPDQIPDIVVTLKSVTYFGGEWDVGYFRLKAKDCFNKERPNWVDFKSLTNLHTSSAKILCNFFVADNDEHNYKPMRRAQREKFKVSGILIYSLDVAPHVKDASLKTRITYKIGDKEGETTVEPGHDPIWMKDIDLHVSLAKDLDYAPDLTF